MKHASLSKTKSDEFSAERIELATLLNALSHPARIMIMETLAKRGECICGEIVEVVPLAQSTVSQHLKQLREAGLIRGEIDGPKSCYCINPKALERLKTLWDRFEGKVNCNCKTQCR